MMPAMNVNLKQQFKIELTIMFYFFASTQKPCLAKCLGHSLKQKYRSVKTNKADGSSLYKEWGSRVLA
jgi:hypothetical protein